VVSEAVRRWYEFYDVTPDNKASDVLCNAALNFSGDGYRTIDDIATLLIGTYPGLSATGSTSRPAMGSPCSAMRYRTLPKTFNHQAGTARAP
ncbi:hypothetical protein ACC738_37770, partial [Rhizobium ruizarguesonis]